jgi:hypothetical protein
MRLAVLLSPSFLGRFHLVGNRAFINGLVVLGLGLLASSASSFLEHFAILGTATEFARGLFDGLSVVAFGVAIFVLVRSRGTEQP